jgi:hypothetical protein
MNPRFRLNLLNPKFLLSLKLLTNPKSLLFLMSRLCLKSRWLHLFPLSPKNPKLLTNLTNLLFRLSRLFPLDLLLQNHIKYRLLLMAPIEYPINNLPQIHKNYLNLL